MLFKLITRYLAPKWPYVVGVIVFQFAQSIAALYLPDLNADIINNGVAAGDVGYIWRMGGVMLLVSLAQITASIIATVLAAKAAMELGRDIRAAVFDRVAGFSERELSEFGAGSLITRNTNDVQQVQMVVMMGSTMMVAAPMLAIGGIIMALRQDLGLSWIIGISVPLLLAVMLVIVMRMVPLFRSWQDKLDAVNRILREQLAGLRVIRAFVREDIERERFERASYDLLRVGKRVGDLFVLVFPLSMLIMQLASVAVIWFGGIEIDRGTTQIGTVFAYMMYLMQILMGVVMATFMITMIPRAEVCAERIDDVLQTPTSLTWLPKPKTGQPEPGSVEFDGVGFTYPGADAPVLHDVSFRVEPGQTLAIIGSTGAGKTTIVGLIPRLFDATSGAVRVGGIDVREADSTELWDGIGLVPQKAYLFSGTIATNLRFGNENASDEQLWRALEIAQAAEFVREKDGQLDSAISQGGTNVSGGQRQRLAIARAIVREPRILIFDDSFSALDLTTDANLRRALWSEMPEVTKIVVAQRVSTITDADQILVIDDGRIVGAGTHEELLASNATYQEIVESQQTAEAQA